MLDVTRMPSMMIQENTDTFPGMKNVFSVVTLSQDSVATRIVFISAIFLLHTAIGPIYNA